MTETPIREGDHVYTRSYGPGVCLSLTGETMSVRITGNEHGCLGQTVTVTNDGNRVYLVST